MNGKLLCLQYKYGNKNNLFATYEDTLDTVKRYPIVYGVIPEKFKDKGMILAFLQANKEWKLQFDAAREAERKADTKRRAEDGTVVVHAKGRFLNFTDNAYVDTAVPFGEELKDAEILAAVVENHCPFAFTEKNYDEKTIIKVLKTQPNLVWNVYDYWMIHIKKQPTVVEGLRVKYELYNMPEMSELVFLKCFSLISSDNKDALIQLIGTLYNDFEMALPTHTCNAEIMKKVFSLLDERMQNVIVSRFYSCAMFVKKNVLCKELEQDIIHNCPIAGDILSDETVLKNKLEPSDTEAEVKKKCEHCCRCFMARIWFY